MDSKLQEELASFKKMVGRTVYLDNLSIQVTESILRAALNQFGTVKNVQFIPNYTNPNLVQQCALVEMETSRQAEGIVSMASGFPFMVSAMPRPVRVRMAKAEMFEDRPRQPGREISVRWLDANDPDFQVAKKLKEQTLRNATEVLVMVKHQLEKEEKLAKQQADTLKANYKKFELIEGAMNDRSVEDLAKYYGI